MNFHWRQAEFFDDLRVANRQCLVDCLAFDPLGGERRTCDCGSATEAFELRIFDDSLLADFDLQLHHISALWSADDADADVFACGDFLGSAKCADVSWIFVMFDDFIAVCHIVYFLFLVIRLFRIFFLKLSWVVKGCPLYPNNLSKSLLGHKRLHTQTNALAKQSLKDRLLLYADHKVD